MENNNDLLKKVYRDLETIKMLIELPKEDLMKYNEKEILKILGYREDFNWENRFMLQDHINLEEGIFLVSTVDLGLDHNVFGKEPLYYETMIFEENNNGERDLTQKFCNRYPTKDKAIEMHNIILDKLKTNRYILHEDNFEFI